MNRFLCIAAILVALFASVAADASFQKETVAHDVDPVAHADDVSRLLEETHRFLDARFVKPTKVPTKLPTRFPTRYPVYPTRYPTRIPTRYPT
eukprot:CAMPEP_0172394066 /NCGR_PEP_ID=MMETSP1061-20121228/13327_1 /TAXON_ID=37318 /ORGANISM="Pseudo-nitzschia pungens, Strain cf. pungens" /LENGTH=92 /DNA_ID=CAMNT_0013125337 /DNA_START=97 /DNA_END=371 /DNA_ORIENTATION=-